MRVRPVQSRADLAAFIDLPYRLHARDPVWVPPLRYDVSTTLSRTKNPFFEHAEAQYFLAEREGQVVGRIAATENRLHNETHEDRVGFWGWFECIDDQAVASALFDAADAWLRPRGLTVSRGPASFSVNDQIGLLIDGFETRPAFMMPHNPRYYAALVEGAGYVKAKDLVVLEGGGKGQYKPVAERAARAATLVTQRLGITLRPLDFKDFDAELARIKALYNACWEKNWGFVPLTGHEIDHLAAQFKPVAIPDLVPIVEKDGVPIGFGLTLPDLNVALYHNRRGRLLPFLLKTFWLLKTQKLDRARVLLLGVVPEWRGRGVDAVIYHWIYEKAAEHGIYWGEGSWVLEDNLAMSMALQKMGFQIYKTYRVYDRPL